MSKKGTFLGKKGTTFYEKSLKGTERPLRDPFVTTGVLRFLGSATKYFAAIFGKLKMFSPPQSKIYYPIVLFLSFWCVPFLPTLLRISF